MLNPDEQLETIAEYADSSVEEPKTAPKRRSREDTAERPERVKDRVERRAAPPRGDAATDRYRIA